MMAVAHIRPHKQRNVGVVTEQRSQERGFLFLFFLQSRAGAPNSGKSQLSNCLDLFAQASDRHPRFPKNARTSKGNTVTLLYQHI